MRLSRMWLWTLLAVGLWPRHATGAGEASWKKAFELPRSRAYFLTVWADANGWIAAAHGVIVRSRDGRIETTPVPGKIIMGFDSTKDGLFALGTEQTILRFDSKEWLEEHSSPLPKKGWGPRQDGALLYRARVFRRGTDAITAAYGPYRVLVRQADGIWNEPVENERYRLNMLGQLGPSTVPRPSGCSREYWHWLDDAEGWFSCVGGHSFRYDHDRTMATGSLPGPCRDELLGVAAVEKDTYLLCRSKVWKSTGGRWVPVSGLQNIVAIAGNSRCLFAATPNMIWERCEDSTGAGR